MAEWQTGKRLDAGQGLLKTLRKDSVLESRIDVTLLC